MRTPKVVGTLARDWDKMSLCVLTSHSEDNTLSLAEMILSESVRAG